LLFSLLMVRRFPIEEFGREIVCQQTDRKKGHFKAAFDVTGRDVEKSGCEQKRHEKYCANLLDFVWWFNNVWGAFKGRMPCLKDDILETNYMMREEI
jgi:hypothetical protein